MGLTAGDQLTRITLWTGAQLVSVVQVSRLLGSDRRSNPLAGEELPLSVPVPLASGCSERPRPLPGLLGSPVGYSFRLGRGLAQHVLLLLPSVPSTQRTPARSPNPSSGTAAASRKPAPSPCFLLPKSCCCCCQLSPSLPLGHWGPPLPRAGQGFLETRGPRGGKQRCPPWVLPPPSGRHRLCVHPGEGRLPGHRARRHARRCPPSVCSPFH